MGSACWKGSKSDEANLPPPTHFVLLQHGSHGNPGHLKYVRKHCEALFGPLAVVFDTTVNRGLRTNAGTMKCADRLYEVLRPALLDFIEGWRKYEGGKYAPLPQAGDGDADGDATAALRQPLYFSCVAHSFGGLLIREIAHRVARDNELGSHLTFHSFVSLAAPHLGATIMNPALRLKGLLIGKLYSTSYNEMLLETDLMYTTLVDDEHIAALARFRHRYLYANTSDHLVSLPSASLRFDLFEELFPDGERGARAFQAYSSVHPHVVVPKEGGGPRFRCNDAVRPEVSADRAAPPAEMDKRLVAMRDRLLRAGEFILFPTHFDFFINITHAYIVGLGKIRGPRTQDVSHHVALMISEGHRRAEAERVAQLDAIKQRGDVIAAGADVDESVARQKACDRVMQQRCDACAALVAPSTAEKEKEESAAKTDVEKDAAELEVYDDENALEGGE